MLSRLAQRSSSGRASVCGRAGGRPAAPSQPAGEAGRGHAQPGPKFKEQHSGSAEHHQTGQPGKWMRNALYFSLPVSTMAGLLNIDLQMVN